VPPYLLISSAHSSGRLRKSTGVTVTNSRPTVIGTVRNPTMPMSWNSGSQDTMTSRSRRSSEACTIAVRLAKRLRWVIRTAFGSAVEPLVSCSSAVSSSPCGRSGTGGSTPANAAPSSAIGRTVMPRWVSTSASGSNGGPSSTMPAPIIPSTCTVSSAQAARSVRGVGW
jgi:hypothetical protein